MERLTLLTDKDIASELRISPEWVRQQRMLRNHGKPHILQVDPVYIGTRPRYLAEEFYAWMEQHLSRAKKAPSTSLTEAQQ